MRVLVLGGTWFLGRTVVEEALQRGHEVTAFNRGQSGPDTPGVRSVRGDRTNASDIAALLDHGPWDAVIDCSGMVPKNVLACARSLVDAAPRYAFVSTVNVYKGWPVDPLSEGSPIRDCEPDASDEPDSPSEKWNDQYARLKAGCERAVSCVYEDAALVLRPGVIIGPYEYIGRLPWWLRRLDRGGRVLAPGLPGRQIQPIDARDIAIFILDAVTLSVYGTYNLAAPMGHGTFSQFLAICRDATRSNAELVWVDDDFLTSRGVTMWTELPLWRTYVGTWSVDAEQARRVGLVCRPLRETVMDTWRWLTEGGTPVNSFRAREIGMHPEKEMALLAAWEAHRALH
jgi:2'-hydroxyisoflavone reductase